MLGRLKRMFGSRSNDTIRKEADPPAEPEQDASKEAKKVSSVKSALISAAQVCTLASQASAAVRMRAGQLCAIELACKQIVSITSLTVYVRTGSLAFCCVSLTMYVQGIKYDFRRVFLTCLMVSAAEFCIIHLTNLFILSPILVLPFVAGWQLAIPLAFFGGATGISALTQSFRSVRAGKMLRTTALALTLVCSHTL